MQAEDVLDELASKLVCVVGCLGRYKVDLQREVANQDKDGAETGRGGKVENVVHTYDVSCMCRGRERFYETVWTMTRRFAGLAEVAQSAVTFDGVVRAGPIESAVDKVIRCRLATMPCRRKIVSVQNCTRAKR